MVDCWRFWCQHSVHFFENMKGWQLVCEDGWLSELYLIQAPHDVSGFNIMTISWRWQYTQLTNVMLVTYTLTTDNGIMCILPNIESLLGLRLQQKMTAIRLLPTVWSTRDIWEGAYEGVSKSFRTGRLKRELQMIQLFATRWSFIVILWVSLVSFADITLCVASKRVFVVVVVYFIIDSVRKTFITWNKVLVFRGSTTNSKKDFRYCMFNCPTSE
jgi:hypothetical protein